MDTLLHREGRGMTTLEQGTYLCRWEAVCKRNIRFKDAVTLPVQIRGADGQLKTIQKLNPCTHGGGPGCVHWRRLTNQELGGRRRLPETSTDFQKITIPVNFKEALRRHEQWRETHV